MSMGNTGRNNWWLIVLSIVLVLFIYLAANYLEAAFVVNYLHNGIKPEEGISEFIHNYPNKSISALLTNLPFIIGAIGIILIVKFIHKRDEKTLITPYSKIDYRKILKSAAVYFLIKFTIDIIYSYYNSNSFQFAFNFDKFIPLALVTLLIVPIQTSFEEFLHRGYLLPVWTKIFRYPIISLLISSYIFGKFHLQSQEYLYFYITMGFFLGLITIISNSLEIAIGIHAVHNLYGHFISDSLQDTSVIFHNGNPENMFVWVAPVILTFIYYMIKYGTGSLMVLISKPQDNIKDFPAYKYTSAVNPSPSH